MVHASPTLSYPCSQTESIRETAVSEGEETRLIQRDHRLSRGCWTASTTSIRSLRVCDRESGATTVLAEDILGDPLPAPDGAWIAFVAAGPDGDRFRPHIFRARRDGGDLIRLDTQP